MDTETASRVRKVFILQWQKECEYIPPPIGIYLIRYLLVLPTFP